MQVKIFMSQYWFCLHKILSIENLGYTPVGFDIGSFKGDLFCFQMVKSMH